MPCRLARTARTLATASQDKTARLWDAATGKQCGEPLKHDAWVVAVAFSPDGRTLATASWDKTARCGTPPPASHAANR